MYNYNNLSDYEFEILCKDIMQKKLNKKLYTFAKGRDGGIDVTDEPTKKNVVIQVKHYINSRFSDLITSLKKEVSKVEELSPSEYYICCAVNLTAANKTEIYNMFTPYMTSPNNIMSLSDIDDFLQEPVNIDIVRKHYKLWLESTHILNEIENQSIFVDCTSLLYNIENEKNEFVETSCYRQCLDILDHDRILMLLGMPGTGKTITTKMLALYFASNGYRIRYTTNGEISDVKNSLSADKDLKEVILLDDCLGQHYFRMKESQENEILALVKYVAMHKNKKLIMNSRVTIFKQAKEKSIEFKQFVDMEKFKIKFIDMDLMSVEDKGRIFYNHIYFKNMPDEYYNDILKDCHYRHVVMHRNYTPRIIEFVTSKTNYMKVESTKYYEYVMQCLDNPTEIWHDEFSEKLKQEDRIFLTTLYSLTDTSVDEEVLRRAFNHRLKHCLTVDTTRNVWEEVLRRLEGSFVVVIEKYGRREIGVINPSVNDFLSKHLENNELERDEIRETATEYAQVERGFTDSMENIVASGRACEYHYRDDDEEETIILSYICRFEILIGEYQNIVTDYLQKLSRCHVYGMLDRAKLLTVLLTEKYDAFYHTHDYLSDDAVTSMLENMDFEDFCDLNKEIKKTHVDLIYRRYRDAFVSEINRSVSEYLETFDADTYYCDYDMNDLFMTNTTYNGLYNEPDIDKIVETIREYVKDDVYDAVTDKLRSFPSEIFDSIKISRSGIYVDTNDIESYVLGYMEPDDADYEYHGSGGSGISGDVDVLDLIFKNH